VKGYSEDEAINRTLQMQGRKIGHDHVIHDNDNHNNDDHGDNDQYDLVRGAGPSVLTEENVRNKPPASDQPPEQVEGKGGLRAGSGTSHDAHCH